jgi:hypothetical protein
VLGGIRSRDHVVGGDVSVAAPLVEAKVWYELRPKASPIETDNNQDTGYHIMDVRSDPSMPPSARWGVPLPARQGIMGKRRSYG